MTLQLTSTWLLEKEIKKIEAKEVKDKDDKLLLYTFKKELAVLKELQIKGIDLRGEAEDVIKRIKENVVYFVKKEEYDELIKKAQKYDEIKRIIEVR